MVKPHIAIEEILKPEKRQAIGEQIDHFIEEGGCFQDLYGLTMEEMEKKYAKAYDQFQHGHYKDASAAFAYLVALNPYIKKFWMALAAAQVHSEDYHHAIVSYSTAAVLEPNDPYPHWYAAPCYLQLGDQAGTEASLRMAKEISKRTHTHREIEEKAEQLLKEFSKRAQRG